MIDYKKLVEVNEKLESIDVKKKKYVMVNERIKGFREICPNGCITSQIISMEDGIVTIIATIKDENGNILSTGLAQEEKTSSFINKTSYIENAETSAVGRALGFLGIGVDGSMASADEVANAILNQNKPATINDMEVKRLDAALSENQKEWALNKYNVSTLAELTPAQYAAIFRKLQKQKEANNG